MCGYVFVEKAWCCRKRIFLLWGSFLVSGSVGFSVNFLLLWPMFVRCIFQGNSAEHIAAKRGM